MRLESTPQWSCLSDEVMAVLFSFFNIAAHSNVPLRNLHYLYAFLRIAIKNEEKNSASAHFKLV